MQIQLSLTDKPRPPIRRSLRTHDMNKMLRDLELLIRGFRDVRDSFMFRLGCFFGEWEAYRGEAAFVKEHDLTKELLRYGFVRFKDTSLFVSLFDETFNEFSRSETPVGPDDISVWVRGNEVVAIRSETSDRGKHVNNQLVFCILDPAVEIDLKQDYSL